MITYKDVLSGAIERIESGNYSSCNDGECPYCAIAEAKTALDEANGTGVSIASALMYPRGGLPSDKPLEEARDKVTSQLGDLGPPLSKLDALELLRSIT